MSAISHNVLSSNPFNDISSAVSSSQNVRTFRADYTIDKEIGRGRFAKVCKVIQKVDNSVSAAKIIRRWKNGSDTIDNIRREIEILRLSDSSTSIVSIQKYYIAPTEVCIILEYSSGGDLYHHVVNSDENLSEAYVRDVIQQLLEAIIFLHSASIVHLDIKPENILLRRPFPEREIALCDFGLAKYLDGQTEIRDLVGTPDYAAPEILDYNPIQFTTDIWSVGVVTYYLLTSESPFWASTREDTFHNISQMRISYDHLLNQMSRAAISFMQSLIRKNPAERPGATDCAALSWFSHQHLGGSSLVEVTPTHPESNADLSGSSIPLSTILTPTTSAIVGNNSLAEHFTFSNSVTDSSDHCPSQASPCLSGGTKPQATEGSAHQATEDRT